MEKMKPILFNTDMVRAILNGRKTVTRRVVKLPHCGYFEHEPPLGVVPPYRSGDILYVRETWGISENLWSGMDTVTYKANYDSEQLPNIKWRPASNMPKEAARIFLRVTDVRVERLQNITDDDIVSEGLEIGCDFEALWDSTFKQADRPLYGWEANPWVWVIEFERISKYEAMS